MERKPIGWKMIAGLGIGLVVAGQFAGWNYGLGRAAWPDMVVATLLMAVLTFALSLCVAELATALPNAGGLYVYSEAAFGRAAGYGVGVAVFVALAVGTGAAAEFISAYFTALTGYGGPAFKLLLFAIIIGIHIKGVGEALGVMMIAGSIAVASLLSFDVVMLPHFDVENILPTGAWTISAAGIFACVPFAIMLFLAVEQTATSAEEADNIARDVPLGMLVAVGTLLVTGLAVLVLAPGAGGAEKLGQAADPLMAAMAATPGGKALWLAPLVGIGALFGLVATLFSIIFSASRQLFALGRGGYLPKIVARQTRAGTPAFALCAVGVIGYPLSFISPDKIIVTMVLLLSLSYCAVLAAFIHLRVRRPEMNRPFRAPGGVATASTAFVLSALVFVASLVANPDAIVPVIIVLLAASAWFFIGARSDASRHPPEDDLPGGKESPHLG